MIFNKLSPIELIDIYVIFVIHDQQMTHNGRNDCILTINLEDMAVTKRDIGDS